MTDPARSGADVVGRAVVLGVVVAALVAACGDQRQQEQAVQPCAPPGGSFAGTSRDGFVAWAGRINYQSADTTLAYVYGFAPADSVRIQAAVLDTTGPGGTSPYGCVYARITSGRAFPALGLGVGANYLWADSVAGDDRTIVIPADASMPITVHPLVLHAHTAGATAPPTVGVYGGCGQCKKMWCRSALDSISTAARLAEPGEVARLRGADLR